MDITIEVEISVGCEHCGSSLKASYGQGELTVSPCEECLAGEYDKGYEVGSEEGYNQGQDDTQAEKAGAKEASNK